MTNPDNFVERRDALMRLSVEMPALTAAWKVTGRKKYAEHAARHLRAWFVDGAPRMNPHLEYAQAIHGRRHGRDVNANRRAVPRNGDGRLVEAWAELHQDELQAGWDLLYSGRRAHPVEPLK